MSAASGKETQDSGKVPGSLYNNNGEGKYLTLFAYTLLSAFLVGLAVRFSHVKGVTVSSSRHWRTLANLQKLDTNFLPCECLQLLHFTAI
jgi:hypothetical protein